MRRRLVASLIALPVIVLLAGLGVWQLERLAWKRDVQATMQQRMTEAPRELADILALPSGERDWRPVVVDGRFVHDREMPLYRQSVEDNKPGYDILTPLIIDGGGAVLINRGWVPPDQRPLATRTNAPEGLIRVTGIVREIGERQPFANDNSPSTREWYWIDPVAMQAFAGIELLPVVVVADRDDDPAILPRGGQIRLDLPNNHLQYALTWFVLAGALAVIYGIWMMRDSVKKVQT